jgi:hypothetical protein
MFVTILVEDDHNSPMDAGQILSIVAVECRRERRKVTLQ